MNEEKLFEISKKFKIAGMPIQVEKCKNGHINKTYEITYALENGNKEKYILQHVNSEVFGELEKLNNNIVEVTDYIREKTANTDIDLDRVTIKIIKTKDDEIIYNYNWRMQKFINNTKTFLSTDKVKILYESGKAIGRFQKYLNGFKAEELYEVIPKFHYTKGRLDNLKEAIESNENLSIRKERFDLAKEVIEFATNESRTNRVTEITDKLQSKHIPYRVTHNDTKLSNILFDKDTDEAVCLIDLDTVMPGALAYDFGEGLRTSVSKSKEDEQDLSKIKVELERFEAFTKGFLQEMKGSITKEEKDTLVTGLWMMTYENGIRFLTDYLNGDIYFNVDPNIQEHNLIRTKAQFELLRQIENNEDKMKEVVEKYGL